MPSQSHKFTDLWTKSEAYASHFQSADDIERTLELLELNNHTWLLDIGCGNGTFSVAAARRVAAGRVLAFDALRSAVTETKARVAAVAARNVDVALALATELPVANDVADRALSRFVLHHIATPHEFFVEVFRALRPGGLFLLQTPCNYWDESMGSFLSEMFLLMDESHLRHYYQPSDIASELKRAHFEPEEPECELFDFPFIFAQQAALIEKAQLDEKLRLRQVAPDTWMIELYWTRIVARKV